MPLLTVTINRNSDGVFTVLPVGSIDSDTYLTLEENVDAILKPAPKVLIFDMKDVKYISSMGIKAILTAKAKVERDGGTLVMINLQSQIRKVFDIVRAIPSSHIFTGRSELDHYLATMQHKEIEKRKAA